MLLVGCLTAARRGERLGTAAAVGGGSGLRNDGPSMRMVMLQAVEQRVDEGLFLEQLMPLGQIEI